ncbi:MAG: fibronectin type III domain-containing protein [Lachnospiraceae bacterium]
MKKRWMSGTLALLLAGTTVASMMPAVSVKAEGNTATGTTYYVDSKGGNDSNEGTSEGKAFQTLDKVNTLDLEPGDTVLLKKGSVFEDKALKFTKEDSGTAEAPVKISTYGEGSRPQINTNGHGLWELNYGTPLDNQNHKWKGTVSSSILIEDAEYLEIEGLELTNDRNSATDTEKDKAYNDAYAMDRTGVAGVAKDNGTVDHIVLNDLYIHNVTGNVYNKHMTNGGIYFIVAKPTNEGETGIARYNDIQIRNCSLDTVNRWGIAVGYTYQWRQFTTGALSDATMAKYASSNVVIENNYLNHVGGDAITTMYLDRPMVQYNVSENAAEQINTTDYSENQPSLDANGNVNGTQGVGAGRVAAGIWPWKCKNAIFQYNECFTTLNASRGNGDGQPWDADYGDGTNYQYNYSHGNTASTIMFCGPESINNTFRYNISQYEDMGPLDPAGNTGNCQVYNNTFYIKEGLDTIWSTVHRNNGPVDMENNIFYFANKTPVKVRDWNPENAGNKTYSNNLYYNITNLPNDAAAVKVDANTNTKVLVDPGSGPRAVAEDKSARKHEDPTAATVFDGYKLAENSPAINAGKVVVDRNGYTIDHDFFGHKITAVPEIGAAESDAVAALVLRSNVYTVSGTNVSDLPKNTTVEDFLKNVIIDAGVTVTIKEGEKELTATDIVKGGATITLSYEGMKSVTYTVVASSDKELKDCYYEVKGTTMSVPYTDNNPATVKEVKANITVADTATVSVLNGENELADIDNVTAGMILRITAENGDTNDYIIAQKNTYNWTLDYVNGQQGNVWFGQIKDGSGDWANMTAVDKDGWPNWATHTYYGPGIDAPQGTITTTNPSVHGLLSAPPSTDISTAMAYRVPKSGTVTFNVKDDEPYLRQSGNAKGTVTLGLFVNDTKKESVTLVKSQEKVGEWEKPVELEVAQGDIIRVVAKCNENPTKPSAHITPIITYVDKAAADTKAPTVPTEVTVTDITTTTAKVTWTASTDNVGVAGYNVYVNDSDTPVNSETLVTGTEYALESLTAGTEYKVTVKAVDAAGNVSEGAVHTFTTAPSAPSAPTEVTVTDVTATAAKVTWKAPADNDSVVGYKVYLNNVQVNKELVTTTEYDLSELKETTDYSVTVCSVNAAGKESEKSAEVTFKTQKTEEPTDTVKPSVPGNVVVPEASITQTGATITWEASTDNVAVTGYNVYMNDTKVNATPVTVTTYNLTGLTAGTEYTVTVTAVDAAGNESAGSDQATFTTLAADETKDSVAPSVPGNVVVPEASITQTGAKITWEESKDDTAVVGYNVYVNEAKVNDEPVKGLELELTGLTPDTEYTVTVTAVDATENESVRSAAFTFTTLKNEEPAPEKPSAPINVKVTDIKWRTAKVTWEAAPERAAVKKYNVYLNDVKVKSTDETECLLENLTGDTLYAVAVTAMAEDGTESDKAVLEEVTEEGIEKGKFKTQVDKEELQETAKNVDKVLENKENYTEESLKNLQDAYNNCQKVLEDKNATLDQVDEAKKTLKKAFDDLKTKDDGKKDDGKKDDGKQDDGKQDDGKKEDPKKDPTPTPGPVTPTPTTTPTPSTTPQSGAKPAAPSGNTNTGSTNAGGTTTGSTSTTKVAKTGDTANAAAWLFTLAASAVAGTVIVKRKRED